MRSLFIFAVAAGALCLIAADTTTPVFRSTTHLIQVSAVVHSHGKPVADLKKEDFHLFDNGKEQKISVFSVESTNGALPSSNIKLPPGVYTNALPAKPGSPQSVTVILMDMPPGVTGSRMAEQFYANQQLIKFLKTIHPEERLALYAFGGSGLKVLHDYTTDSSDLLRALDATDGKHIPDASDGQPMSFGSALISVQGWSNGAMQTCTGRMVDIQRRIKVIELIANHLASLPGRKSLIWYTRGFPLLLKCEGDFYTFDTEIKEAVNAANNANVAIYSVDNRGLMVGSQMSAENSKISTKAPSMVGVANQQTMEEFSSRTGGKAYYNNNDLKGAIRSAIGDSEVTYTLGYYPGDEQYDGKFHNFKVKVGRGGVEVRARKGYYDVQNKPTDQKRAAEIHDAVLNPLDSSALALVVQTKRVDKPAPNSLEMIVLVDPKAISFEPVGDRRQSKLDVYFVQKSASGKELTGQDDTISLNLTEPNFTKILHDGLSYHQIVPLSAQASELRVVVRDYGSGTIGSVTVPIRDAKQGLMKR